MKNNKIPKKLLEMEIYTLSDHLPNPYTGKRVTAQERVCEIIELDKAADACGLDFFGVSESHQD